MAALPFIRTEVLLSSALMHTHTSGADGGSFRQFGAQDMDHKLATQSSFWFCRSLQRLAALYFLGSAMLAMYGT